MSDAMPAAPSACPMLPLIEPRRHRRVAAGPMQVAERVRLDHVAQRRTGAVGFDERDVTGARRRPGRARAASPWTEPSGSGR